MDVARDAADIILLKPGLEILHFGVLEGRRASANVLKYLLMGTSANSGNMFSMAATSVFLPFLPMLPTQILLNNFLYDTSQLTIPSDNVDEEYMAVPRPWDMHLIRNFMLFIGPISSIYDFLTFYVLLHFFHAGHAEFRTGWFIEIIVHTNSRHFYYSYHKESVEEPSQPAAHVVGASHCHGRGRIPLFIPCRGFRFYTFAAQFYAFLEVSTLTYLFLVELGKRLLENSSASQG